MSKYIDENAAGDDPSKAMEDDKLLDVRFTTEDRLNHALMTRIDDTNRAHEERAELLDAAHKFDEAKAEREKKLPDTPIMRKIDFVTIRVPGDKTFYSHRPVRAADKIRFRAKYEAFKNASGEPFEGTPVEQMPEIKPSQVETLKYVGITTIEQLAKISDGSPMMSMMGGVGLKQRAAAWVSKNRRSSLVTQTNEAFKERDDQIAQLQEQVKALLAASEASRTVEPAKLARK